jgi:hypothetical protein
MSRKSSEKSPIYEEGPIGDAQPSASDRMRSARSARKPQQPLSDQERADMPRRLSLTTKLIEAQLDQDEIDYRAIARAARKMSKAAYAMTRR